jgi:hypothetical protein
MHKKTAESTHADCAACKNNRSVSETGSDNRGTCRALEEGRCILETPLEIVQAPQLSDYTELIW